MIYYLSSSICHSHIYKVRSRKPKIMLNASTMQIPPLVSKKPDFSSDEILSFEQQQVMSIVTIVISLRLQPQFEEDASSTFFLSFMNHHSSRSNRIPISRPIYILLHQSHEPLRSCYPPIHHYELLYPLSFLSLSNLFRCLFSFSSLYSLCA